MAKKKSNTLSIFDLIGLTLVIGSILLFLVPFLQATSTVAIIGSSTSSANGFQVIGSLFHITDDVTAWENLADTAINSEACKTSMVIGSICTLASLVLMGLYVISFVVSLLTRNKMAHKLQPVFLALALVFSVIAFICLLVAAGKLNGDLLGLGLATVKGSSLSFLPSITLLLALAATLYKRRV